LKHNNSNGYIIPKNNNKRHKGGGHGSEYERISDGGQTGAAIGLRPVM